MKSSLFSLTLVMLAGAFQALSAASGAAECRPNFRQNRQGDCWTKSSLLGKDEWFWVHKHGWAVQEACIKAFPAIVGDLDKAYQKMDPHKHEPTGCMGTYNPALGAQWVNDLWTKIIIIGCPSVSRSEACGATSSQEFFPPGRPGPGEKFKLISINAPQRCRFEHSENDAEMLFHETLHAVGFGSFPVQKHNRSYNLEQYEFIKDTVYAASMVCFMGTKPRLRKQVNYLQCENLVREGRPEADASICSPEQRGFNAEFSNAPQHMYVH